MEKIIAFDGGSRYLVSLNGDWQTVQNDFTAMGQVVDVASGLAMQPFHLQALISRGEWLPFDGNLEVEAQVFARMQSDVFNATTCHA